ncbi:conserved hypothetical protein [Methylobacterium sp. 4-46]|uniref:YARHG domain-containing protein n=1 Tax=unclassified Methylobacterium TaxID=2615210 RepID=UPI000152DDF9|nr:MULTISPECIES: YARHG domain-containing protein [Methylobacterium]ACA17348.1 conserved hypothetical protein [Methylobacterium sp. 4-46]WFT83035.1 YARHG domain-containing protein [Methylobacterium nodulans]
MAHRSMLPTLALAGLACAAALSPVQAFAQGCEELWYQRNRIFKEAGYCFRTPRGIRAFGNAGCLYDDERQVPLSANQREAVTAIRRTESVLGCTP